LKGSPSAGARPYIAMPVHDDVPAVERGKHDTEHRLTEVHGDLHCAVAHSSTDSHALGGDTWTLREDMVPAYPAHAIHVTDKGLDTVPLGGPLADWPPQAPLSRVRPPQMALLQRRRAHEHGGSVVLRPARSIAPA